MQSPFPGMNPYWEQPAIWADVHARLIVGVADVLAPLVRPRYRVNIELRTYVMPTMIEEWSGRPDVMVVERDAPAATSTGATLILDEPIAVQVPMLEEAREHFLQVREIGTGRIVTVIEILSPANKQQGEGRRAYQEKRNEILSSRTHLVEIDLLRAGEPLPLRMANAQAIGHYRILVSCAHARPRADLYPFSVRDAIPVFAVPLLQGDSEPHVDLNPLVQQVYELGGYDLDLDYQRAPLPPWNDADETWADQLLREKNLRAG